MKLLTGQMLIHLANHHLDKLGLDKNDYI
jgi:hypothetical protein